MKTEKSFLRWLKQRVKQNKNNMYNPTCFFTGAKDLLKMHPMRNDNGDMVGWIFVHNSIEMKDVSLDHTFKMSEEANRQINLLKVLNSPPQTQENSRPKEEV